jgi:alkaline phosphatase D
MKQYFFVGLIFLSSLLSAQSISKIAFGSCSNENKPQPILNTISQLKPDVFVYLGDNIYGDTEDMKKLEEKYNKLGTKPEFQKLKKATKVLATWDDHDYGKDDAGLEYPKKQESKEVFLNFWGEPKDSERRNHEGIYTSYYFNEGEQTIQLILLDNRTFRTKLKKGKKDGINGYVPHDGKNNTMLGELQWQWLQQELQKPATIRIIASSTQFVPEYNGYEAWVNMPQEKNKMLQLIKSTQAKGLVFISGDTHYAEISKMNNEGFYPLYETTSSGLTQTWPSIGENQYRIGDAFSNNNFGLIAIDWKLKNLEMSVHNAEGTKVLTQTISFKEILAE